MAGESNELNSNPCELISVTFREEDNEFVEMEVENDNEFMSNEEDSEEEEEGEISFNNNASTLRAVEEEVSQKCNEMDEERENTLISKTVEKIKEIIFSKRMWRNQLKNANQMPVAIKVR